MKHFTRLTALLLVVASLFIIPGYAVADDNPYINGMAQGSIAGTGDYYHKFTTADKVDGYYSFDYALYHTLSLNYVDIVLKFSGAIPSSLKVNGSTLTRVSLGNSLYRFYGSVSTTARNLLPFQFTAGGAFEVSILNFNMAVNKVDHFTSAGVLLVDGVQKETWTASANGNGVSLPADDWSEVEGSKDFQVKITDWKGADYAELLISAKNISFGSISAFMDATIIPIQVDSVYTSEDIVEFGSSHVGGLDEGSSSTHGSYFPGDYYDDYQSVTEWSESVDLDGNSFSSSAPADRVFRVRLDLRAVDRTMSSVPIVRFTAKYSGYYGYTFKCAQIICFVDVDGLDDSWLSAIEGFFSELKTNLVFHLAAMKEGIVKGIDNMKNTLAGNPDNVENESSTMESHGDVISGYEDEYQSQLEDGSETLRDTMNFGNFATALSFVSGFVGTVAVSLGDYLVVFTLPLVLGFILFLCSRAPYNMKPRTSSTHSNKTSTRTDGSDSFDIDWRIG